MTKSELPRKLDELLRLPHETEWVEFKEARKNYDFSKGGIHLTQVATRCSV